MRALLLAVVASCFFPGCQTPEHVAQIPANLLSVRDDDAMKTEVLKYVFVGMPVAKAQDVMELQGFDCWDKPTNDRGQGCLYCRLVLARSTSWDTYLHGEEWENVFEVWLGTANGTITDVQVTHHFGKPFPPDEKSRQ